MDLDKGFGAVSLLAGEQVVNSVYSHLVYRDDALFESGWLTGTVYSTTTVPVILGCSLQ